MLHIAVFENIMQQLIAIINLNGWFTHINIKNQDIKKLIELLSSEREDSRYHISIPLGNQWAQHSIQSVAVECY